MMDGKIRRIQILIAVIIGALGMWTIVGPTGAAAQSRYSNSGWQDPSTQRSNQHADQTPGLHQPREHRADARMRKLLKELRGLIHEAGEAGAADRRFLRDLRKLVRRYDRPRRKRILFDNFSDGNLSHNPGWRASGAGIHVSSYNGLRLRYNPHHRTQNNQNSRQSSRDALIGSILDQLAGQQPKPQPQQHQIQSKPPRLFSGVVIPNSFSLELQFGSSSPDAGRFVVGVTQGKRRLGYRLAYNPHSNQPIELVRRGKRGAAIIDATHGRLKLEDGKLHKLQLSRDRHGEMTVRVDGKVLIRTVDRAFRGRFDGVTMINRGGDYTIRSIRVDGERP
jgi:hypothetical protein